MSQRTGQRMHNQVRAAALVGLLVSGIVGCARVTGEEQALATPEHPSQQELAISVQQSESKVQAAKQTVNPKLVAANTRFGFKLFSEILKKDSGKNVFVSPTSVAIALSMTYNGASGETQQAMANALQLQGLSVPELNRANADLKALLENPDTKVQLTIANSLWARQGVSFKPDFLRRNQEFYRAEITELDFQSPSAAATINGWVKQNTRGKISQIVDKLSPNDILFLINAIYFKGSWSREFDKGSTATKPFYLLDGSQKQHPLMSQRGNYRYYETDQFQAVSLPYGNKRFSMYVFLPKKSSNLSAFYKTLTAETWQQWMNQFRSRAGSIEIPRFKLEYDTELKEALTALGMGVAFDRLRANFAGLSDERTKIDRVKHKTFVEVNEEGTEAAAATSVGIVAVSAPVDEPFNLVVDRPFFCAIRDNQTGSVLFMGSIVNPQ